MNITIASSLTSTSSKFARFNGSGSNYYYDQYRITVPVTGSYVFTSVSSINTYDYFYGPRSGSSNYYIIAYDDDGADSNQFKHQMYLQVTTQYIVRVTTYNQYVTGNYIIVASGLNRVTIRRDDGTSTNSSTRAIGE